MVKVVTLMKTVIWREITKEVRLRQRLKDADIKNMPSFRLLRANGYHARRD